MRKTIKSISLAKIALLGLILGVGPAVASSELFSKFELSSLFEENKAESSDKSSDRFKAQLQIIEDGAKSELQAEIDRKIQEAKELIGWEEFEKNLTKPLKLTLPFVERTVSLQAIFQNQDSPSIEGLAGFRSVVSEENTKIGELTISHPTVEIVDGKLKISAEASILGHKAKLEVREIRFEGGDQSTNGAPGANFEKTTDAAKAKLAEIKYWVSQFSKPVQSVTFVAIYERPFTIDLTPTQQIVFSETDVTLEWGKAIVIEEKVKVFGKDRVIAMAITKNEFRLLLNLAPEIKPFNGIPVVEDIKIKSPQINLTVAKNDEGKVRPRLSVNADVEIFGQSFSSVIQTFKNQKGSEGLLMEMPFPKDLSLDKVLSGASGLSSLAPVLKNMKFDNLGFQLSTADHSGSDIQRTNDRKGKIKQGLSLVGGTPLPPGIEDIAKLFTKGKSSFDFELDLNLEDLSASTFFIILSPGSDKPNAKVVLDDIGVGLMRDASGAPEVHVLTDVVIRPEPKEEYELEGMIGIKGSAQGGEIEASAAMTGVIKDIFDSGLDIKDPAVVIGVSAAQPELPTQLGGSFGLIWKDSRGHPLELDATGLVDIGASPPIVAFQIKLDPLHASSKLSLRDVLSTVLKPHNLSIPKEFPTVEIYNLDARFSTVFNETTVGNMSIPGGVYFDSKFNMFGKNGEMRFELAKNGSNYDFKIFGTIDPLNFLDTLYFSGSSKGTGKPTIDVQASVAAGKPVNPKFLIDGAIKLDLPKTKTTLLSAETHMELEGDTIRFYVKEAIGGDSFNYKGKPILQGTADITGNVKATNQDLKVDFKFEQHIVELIKDKAAADFAEAKKNLIEQKKKVIKHLKEAEEKALSLASEKKKKEAQAKVDAAKKEVEKAEAKLAPLKKAQADATRDLENAKKKLKPLESAYNKVKQKLDNAQAKVNKIQRTIDKNEKKIKKAKWYDVRKAGWKSAVIAEKAAKKIASKALDVAKAAAKGATYAAYQSGLAAVKAAQAAVDASTGAAYQTALASLKTAEGALSAAKASAAPVLEASAHVGAAGVRVGEALAGAGLDVAKAFVDAADKAVNIAEFLEKNFNITEFGYKGTLSKVKTGKLGNVSVAGKLVGKNYNAQINIDLSGGIKGLEKAVEQIVKDAIKEPLNKVENALDNAVKGALNLK